MRRREGSSHLGGSVFQIFFLNSCSSIDFELEIFFYDFLDRNYDKLLCGFYMSVSLITTTKQRTELAQISRLGVG